MSGCSSLVGGSFSIPETLTNNMRGLPIVAQKERKGVGISVVLLKDVDIQKTYKIGEEATNKNNGIFNGVNIFTFTGNPPRDKQTLNLFVGSENIEKVVTEITGGLELLPNKDYLVVVWPTSQFVARSRPSQTAT